MWVFTAAEAFIVEDFTVEDFTAEDFMAEDFTAEDFTAEDFTAEDFTAEDLTVASSTLAASEDLLIEGPVIGAGPILGETISIPRLTNTMTNPLAATRTLNIIMTSAPIGDGNSSVIRTADLNQPRPSAATRQSGMRKSVEIVVIRI